MTNDLRVNSKNGDISISVILDEQLSAVFYTADHNILFGRFKKREGLSGLTVPVSHLI